MREALQERSLLLNVLAPHLVRPVPFLFPLTRALGARRTSAPGMLLYDALGGHKGLRRHRHLTKRGALRLAPGAEARLARRRAAVLGRAGRRRPPHARDRRAPPPHYGAAVACRTRGRSAFLQRGAGASPACACATSSAAPSSTCARARSINATGVWTDDVQHLVGERGKFQVRASKGDPPRRPARPAPARHRADPAHGEERAVRDPVGPALDRRHHRHRLGARQGAPGGQRERHRLRARPGQRRARLSRSRHEDVEGVYAGLRPLLDRRVGEHQHAQPRAHRRGARCPGMVAVAGGKYTTYRVMARDAVDAAARGLDAHVPRVGDATSTPLVGADGYQRAVEPAPPAGRRERPARRAHRAPARPLRLAHPTSCSR